LSKDKSSQTLKLKKGKIMSIISDNKPVGPAKEYPIASEGAALLVLADVFDIGMKETKNGMKPSVRFSWVVDEKDPDGNYFVIEREFTNSLHENALLYPVVVDILGKVPKLPFDLETLIGRVSLGTIKHKAGIGRHEGRQFANIVAFLTPKPGQTLAIPKSFVRGKDGGRYGKLPQARTNNQPSRTPPPAQAAMTSKLAPQQEIADDDIPF
jgi:hypothetical protein